MLTRAYPSWVPVAAGAVSNAMQHRLKSLIMYQYETPVLIHLLKLAQLAFFVAQPLRGTASQFFTFGTFETSEEPHTANSAHRYLQRNRQSALSPALRVIRSRMVV